MPLPKKSDPRRRLVLYISPFFIKKSHHELADALETVCEVGRGRAEADAQVAVHAEMNARHDQGAFFVDQVFDELG